MKYLKQNDIYSAAVCIFMCIEIKIIMHQYNKKFTLLYDANLTINSIQHIYLKI